MKNNLKFAHLADLHLGGWREKSMKELNFNTFIKLVDDLIKENVDFVIFAGDIFDSPMPELKIVNNFVLELNRLKEHGIPIYVIGGSHDYSNIGDSFISLLDKTGVLIDVCNFERIENKIKLNYIKNQELKLNIVGVLGKKHGLDKNIYLNIKKDDLDDNYLNIFVFHTTLNNFKPDFMKSVKTEVSMNYLPNGFDYYAGGHIHKNMIANYGNGKISYSGCLFPNNFSELKREEPTYNLCKFDFSTRNLDIEVKKIKSYEKIYLNFEFENETPLRIYDIIMGRLEKEDLNSKIVLLEVSGVVEGKISDINFNKIISFIYSKGAIQVLKNTYKLINQILETKKEEIKKNIDEIEEFIINENLKDKKKEDMMKDKELINKLLNFSFVKLEAEKNKDYEERIIKAMDKILEIEFEMGN